MRYYNLDIDGTIFFQRELEKIKDKVFEDLDAPLSAQRLIPVDRTTPPGAKSVTYTVYSSSGTAKIISNGADDLPTADAGGIQKTSYLKSIGNCFIVSLEDLRAAQFTGKDLEARKAKAALKAHLQKFNSLAFYGDVEHGVAGWLTNTDILTQNATGHWLAGGATTDQIVDDLNSAIATMMDTTNGVEEPDTIVMPIRQYQYIATKRMVANSDTTILQAFSRNNPGIKVTYANELKGHFTGNVDGAIVYKNSSDKFWQEIPQDFETLEPQFVNLVYKVPCHSKHGGTIVAYPQSQRFIVGI
jgi:hypothetical protein